MVMKPQDAVKRLQSLCWINTCIINLFHLRLAPGWVSLNSDTDDTAVNELFLQAESERTRGREGIRMQRLA